MKISFLQAFNGDSILISFEDEESIKRNILIDGGTRDTYRARKNHKGKPEAGPLKTVIENIRSRNEVIDLLILTHVDDDHIAGILDWLGDDDSAHAIIREVWFNSGSSIARYLSSEENKDLKIFVHANKDGMSLTSIDQGIELSQYLMDKKIKTEPLVIQGMELERMGLKFRILSPGKTQLSRLLKEWKKKDPDLMTAGKVDDYSVSLKEHCLDTSFDEDTSVTNGSSIACILECKGLNLLLLGDAHPSVVVEGLKKYGYSHTSPVVSRLVKLSHHGSRHNNSMELIRMIKTNTYLVSTNGRHHCHPHKSLLAHIINTNKQCVLLFNYEEQIEKIFSDQDRIDFPDFKCEVSNEKVALAI